MSKKPPLPDPRDRHKPRPMHLDIPDVLWPIVFAPPVREYSREELRRIAAKDREQDPKHIRALAKRRKRKRGGPK